MYFTKENFMKNTMTLLGLCLLSLIPGLAAAQLSSQELDYQGESIYSKGFYAKSIPYFQQAIQADPNNAKAYEDLGNAYLKQNDQTDAIAAFQQSLQINPNNSTLKALVDSMSANGTTAPPPQTQSTEPSYNQGTEAPPAQETFVVRRRRPRLENPPPNNWKDGLAPMDHAKIWVKYEMGYNYSAQGDLMNSVTNVSNANTSGTLPFNFTNGAATMPPGGLELGGELGFLLNPYNGIAIGIRYIQSNDYIYQASNTSNTQTPPYDNENATFTPYVVPLTLDYYFFLPDSGGRFFLTGGIGYYMATVNVSENYSLNNYEGSPTYGSPTGDLTAGNIGFQLGIGRDFAINRNFGISIYGRFRYAQISNFTGNLSDGNTWALEKSSSGIVDIDLPGNIAANKETYATIDFTGFDIGASLNFYSF
jgi:tetratricopeptide (TPR) repeat protein